MTALEKLITCRFKEYSENTFSQTMKYSCCTWFRNNVGDKTWVVISPDGFYCKDCNNYKEKDKE